MSNDDNPIRFSHLRAYGRSGAHGYQARFGTEAAPSAAMESGTAVHAILFNTQLVCGYPGAARRGKEYDAFAAEHAGYEILTMTAYDKARRMADSVLACELAQEALSGTSEETLHFRWMGRDCRSTPDVRGAKHITELKTAMTSDPSRFQWHALRMQYHAQMQMESLACKAAKGFTPLDCYVVVVESAEPYPVTVFRFEERALQVGEQLLMSWMERLKICEESRVWPGYVSCLVPIDVPDEDEPLVFSEGLGELSAEESLLLGATV